jgi:O-antigen/teichoic acid export membrane protein
MVVFNMIFIPMYGIEGAALATFLSVFIYNTIKLLFVVTRMKLYPFTKKTGHSFGIIVVGFLLFYFWDFPFYTLINIGLKSVLITIFYVYVNYKLVISEEFNNVVVTLLQKLKVIK